jgi:probable rRNA maturation factor
VRNSQRTLRLPAARIRDLARRVLRSSRFTDGELSISLVGDAEIRDLNRRYRGKDRATDVLAFSLAEGDHGGVCPGLLGDVVVSTGTAARQANAAGHSPQREVALLLIHGILHLLGRDHAKGGAAARAMRNEQDRLLAEHGGALEPGAPG